MPETYQFEDGIQNTKFDKWDRRLVLHKIGDVSKAVFIDTIRLPAIPMWMLVGFLAGIDEANIWRDESHPFDWPLVFEYTFDSVIKAYMDTSIAFRQDAFETSRLHPRNFDEYMEIEREVANRETIWKRKVNAYQRRLHSSDL